MSNQKRTISREFELAFLAGERSDKRIATALTSLLVEFSKKDNNTTPIIGAVSFMVKTNRNSHRTQAVVKWLKDVGQFTVTGAGEDDADKKVSVKCKKNTDYNPAWLQQCKDTPWYKTARDMQKPSPWRDTLEQTISNEAAGLIMGTRTESELDELFAPKIVLSILAKRDDAEFIEKVNARIARLQEKGMALAA